MTTDILNDSSQEQLKTLHNAKLAEARSAAEDAEALRKEIVRRDGRFSGSSQTRLSAAIENLFLARTFKNAPYDLPAEVNPHRNNG